MLDTAPYGFEIFTGSSSPEAQGPAEIEPEAEAPTFAMARDRTRLSEGRFYRIGTTRAQNRAL